jgi:hypothetical protein
MVIHGYLSLDWEESDDKWAGHVIPSVHIVPCNVSVPKSIAVTLAPSINDSQEQSLLRTQIQALELNVTRKQQTIKEKVSVEKENKVQLQENERKIEVLQEKDDAENNKMTKLSEQTTAQRQISTTCHTFVALLSLSLCVPLFLSAQFSLFLSFDTASDLMHEIMMRIRD